MRFGHKNRLIAVLEPSKLKGKQFKYLFDYGYDLIHTRWKCWIFRTEEMKM
jgi:hypothetical protein